MSLKQLIVPESGHIAFARLGNIQWDGILQVNIIGRINEHKFTALVKLPSC
jgi:hypothetical protein